MSKLIRFETSRVIPLEIKEKWVNTLQDNQFEQAIGSMYQIPNRYDSLGILCMVYKTEQNKGEFIGATLDDGTQWGGFLCGDEWATHIPPLRVLVWAKLKTPLGTWINEDVKDFIALLTLLNDGDRDKEREPWSLAKIGEYIEKSPF